MDWLRKVEEIVQAERAHEAEAHGGAPCDETRPVIALMITVVIAEEAKRQKELSVAMAEKRGERTH